jgi:hypothetical protein
MKRIDDFLYYMERFEPFLYYLNLVLIVAAVIAAMYAVCYLFSLLSYSIQEEEESE